MYDNEDRLKTYAKECLSENGYIPKKANCGYVPGSGYKLYATGIKDNKEYTFSMSLSDDKLVCYDINGEINLDMTKWKNIPIEVVPPKEYTLEEKIERKISSLNYATSKYLMASEEFEKTEQKFLKLQEEYGTYWDFPAIDREEIDFELKETENEKNESLRNLTEYYDELCDLAKGQEVDKNKYFYELEEILGEEQIKRVKWK